MQRYLFCNPNARRRKTDCVYLHYYAHACNIGLLRIIKHKRGTHYSLFSSDGSLNFHLFNDSAPFLVAENDCDARSMGTVNAQINTRKKAFIMAGELTKQMKHK